MSNPSINVSLSSLATGTVPTVTDSVEVAEDHNLDVNVSWPKANNNTISCTLDFSDSGDQDPFNDVAGGSTTFQLVGSGGDTQSASHTLKVKKDATVTTDTYELTLTIDGTDYSTDPKIIVDED